MNLAEELLNIANTTNQKIEEEKQQKLKKEKEILKVNTQKYWESFCIPLLKQRANKGLYSVNLIFAQTGEGHWHSQYYYPVLPSQVLNFDNNLIYDGIKNKNTHLWFSFEQYYNDPIEIEDLINIIHSNGFSIEVEEEERADTKTGSYTTGGYVYTLEISCKQKPKSFRESLLLTDKEKDYHNSGASKGEIEIELFLLKNGIIYERQYCFEDCKYKKELPFDFAIFNANQELQYLIEYDGEQHYKYIPYFHKTEKNFKEQQLRDAIKTQYCQINNINLIRISYMNYDNINQILTNYLL